MDPENFTFERKYHVVRVLRRFDVQYQREPEEIIESERFGPNIVFFRENPEGMRMLGDYFFSYRTPDLNDMFEFVQFAS